MGVDVFANPRIVSDIQGEIIMHRTIRRIVALVGFAAVLSVMFVSVGSSPAQAATRNGKCESGEFCYYYNTDLLGSVSDHGASLADYGAKQPSCYEYKGAGAGKGQCVKNNAAAVWNRTSKTIRVYYNSNYGGSYIDIAAGAKKNLKGSCCYNNNASHRPKPASPPPSGKSFPANNNYPYKGAHSGVDPWNFYKGQCTSWAAWAVRNRLGVAFHNYYKNVHWGNAKNWDNAARQAGIPVYSKPKAGDVAVREGGTWGHVAFVRAVNSDGSIQIEEYNYVKADTYSHRRTTVGTGNSQFSKFIRFK